MNANAPSASSAANASGTSTNRIVRRNFRERLDEVRKGQKRLYPAKAEGVQKCVPEQGTPNSTFYGERVRISRKSFFVQIETVFEINGGTFCTDWFNLYSGSICSVEKT